MAGSSQLLNDLAASADNGVQIDQGSSMSARASQRSLMQASAARRSNEKEEGKLKK